MTAPNGILMLPESLTYGARQALEGYFEEWRQNPIHPLVLDSGIRFRQLLPDGTLEPIFEPELSFASELVSTRDYLPYIVGLGGWIVAIIVVLVR